VNLVISIILLISLNYDSVKDPGDFELSNNYYIFKGDYKIYIGVFNSNYYLVFTLRPLAFYPPYLPIFLPAFFTYLILGLTL
jgi:hypothetical protein